MQAERTDREQTPETADYATLMKRAVEVARQGIAAGQSPFGAVIATIEGEVVIAAHNVVRSACDVTAHAEVTAIRKACAKLQRTDLSGHVIATTCEPCPMCATAIHWARLDAVIFGASIADAQKVHFNELTISTESLFSEGGSPVKVVPHVLRDECLELFELWKNGPNPNPY